MPWPIVGNTFQLPDTKPWIYFEDLSKKYNTPLITYWIGRLAIAENPYGNADLEPGTLPCGLTMRGRPANSLTSGRVSTAPVLECSSLPNWVRVRAISST